MQDVMHCCNFLTKNFIYKKSSLMQAHDVYAQYNQIGMYSPVLCVLYVYSTLYTGTFQHV